MRISVRVRPGASRTAVGGSYGDALVVAVTAPAADGRATAAALAAIAAAFGVRPRAIRLVRGATSRIKLIEVDGDEADLQARFALLRAKG